MGFGNIIATGISIIILLLTGFVILAGTSNSLNLATAAVAGVQHLGESRADTDLRITNLSRIDNSSLRLNVSNTGSTTITDLSCTDVIVKFVDPGVGAAISGKWLAPGSGAGQWHVESVASDTRSAPAITLLLPGETATIVCAFEGSMPSGAGIVSVTAPNGAGTTTTFNLDV